MSDKEDESSTATEFTVPDPEWKDMKDTRHYCEEHIWRYAKRMLDANKNTPDFECYVIVLSHPDRFIHLWKQDISYHSNYLFNQKVNEGLDFWKYHVFLITEYKNKVLVYDFNSTLEFPTEFSTFESQALKHDFETPRYFKVIEAQHYIDTFSSDRRHMKISTGGWIVEPPPYKPILNAEGTSNFETLIHMDEDDAFDEFGVLLTREEFLERFSRKIDESHE